MKSSQKSLVAERWVINASPVIALARVGQVELLKRLPKQVVLPRAVKEELVRAGEDDIARRAVESGKVGCSLAGACLYNLTPKHKQPPPQASSSPPSHTPPKKRPLPFSQGKPR